MKYQLCPKCNGQGTVQKPPWVQGDVNEWASTSSSHICDVCRGAKLLLVLEDNKLEVTYEPA
jgi:DnaJ-class molecular chaperone